MMCVPGTGGVVICLCVCLIVFLYVCVSVSLGVYFPVSPCDVCVCVFGFTLPL